MAGVCLTEAVSLAAVVLSSKTSEKVRRKPRKELSAAILAQHAQSRVMINLRKTLAQIPNEPPSWSRFVKSMVKLS